MITSIFLILLADIISLVASKLSDGTGSAEEFTIAINWFFTQLTGLDYFFPVHEAIHIFRWGLLIFGSILFYKFSMTIYNKFRGIHGST